MLGSGHQGPPPPSPKLALWTGIDNHMENYLRYLNIRHTTAWFFLGKEPAFLVRWILRLAGHDTSADLRTSTPFEATINSKRN
jgi:hypothetical protein